jgi:hypothetical protein
MEDVSDGALAGMGVVGFLIWAAIMAFFIVSGWKIYTKAGQPGWAVLIPIYNLVVMLKIIGKPWWWMFGFLIPFLNFIVLILLAVNLAKVFGKGTGFAIGLILLSIVFYPILAFGDAKYTAPAEAA